MTKQRVKPIKAREVIGEATVKAIIQRIADGETMTAICRGEGMPTYSRLMTRINQSCSLVAALARARETHYNRLADELLDIAEDGTNDYVEREGRNGKVFVALDDEHVRRSQLRIDARKWLLSRLLPAKFGDRVEHTGAGGGPVQVEHTLSKAMIDNLESLRARLPALPAPMDRGNVIDATPEPVRANTGAGSPSP